MVTPRSVNLENRPHSLARRLVWPGTISVVLAAVAACGGSSEGFTADAMGGAGPAAPDCPAVPPTDKAACTTMGKCDYPELNCRCDGPEDARTWKCKQPPEPMTNCPPMPPEEASPCQASDEEPQPPLCHYEAPVVDCKCTDEAWACREP